MPECSSCMLPLGSDTLAMGYDVCAMCRKCATCGMSVGPKDIDFIRELGLTVIKHPRCVTLSDRDLPNQPRTWIAMMNWCSTMSNTETLVKDMSFDQRYAYMQSVQAHAAALSICLRQDKASYEAQLREEELANRQERVKKPIGRPPKAPKPDPIAEVKTLGISNTTSEKVARQKLSARDKAIAGLMRAAALTFEQAAAQVDGAFKARNQTPIN